MARASRRDVLVDQAIQVVHCINRCVRRAFLCGDDKLTGKNYDQRRELIRQRLEFLVGIMGIEVLGYAVMNNHFHCVLRSRYDIVATWSDDEVARKWGSTTNKVRGSGSCISEGFQEVVISV